jgi:hypothetical protein
MFIIFINIIINNLILFFAQNVKKYYKNSNDWKLKLSNGW